MDSTRVTEHPTSHERRQPSAARPTAPADPRGALLRTPEPPAQGSTGLPAQGRPAEAPAPPGIPGAPASDGPCPTGSPTPPGALAAATGTPAASGTPAGSQGPPAPSGGHGPTDAPAGSGSEHSQPSVTEPDPHRPRPAPETIPAQSGAEAAAVQSGKERRTGQGPAPGTPMPMRRDGDRLRFVGAATRRIARGIDLDEIVMGLCRATVPTFSDAILVYLRDPLPVGDERPTGPVVLRLRRTDRIRRGPGHRGRSCWRRAPARARPRRHRRAVRRYGPAAR